MPHRELAQPRPETCRRLPAAIIHDRLNFIEWTTGVTCNANAHMRIVVHVSAQNELVQDLPYLDNGLGIGQIFRFGVSDHIAAGRLVPVLEDWDQPKAPIHLVYPATRRPSAKLRAFADWANDIFGRQGCIDAVRQTGSAAPCRFERF
jgi:DNA-binding transcriptional LysR family regulator